MSVLYDARGNELNGLLDQVGGGTVTDARVSSGTLGSLNAELVMDLNGQATSQFDLRTAAMNATLVFEATLDGTNYFSIPAWVPMTETMVQAVVLTATSALNYQIDCAGYRRIRCRVSVYSTGSVVVTGRASTADAIIYTRPVPSTLMVTATAAVNTAVTATLPAAGANLYHYVTGIQLVKNYSVIGVAGAANIITTTNMPGSPAWTTEQVAGLAGACITVIDFSPTTPVKSLTANTATTFVAPLQLQTIWRWNISYYVAG